LALSSASAPSTHQSLLAAAPTLGSRLFYLHPRANTVDTFSKDSAQKRLRIVQCKVCGLFHLKLSIDIASLETHQSLFRSKIFM
jgi:hypothetical protein